VILESAIARQSHAMTHPTQWYSHPL